MAVPARAGDDGIGDQLADVGLELQVRVALLEQLGFDALDLEVSADAAKGAVSVTGEVADRASRELTDEIVRSVNSDLVLESPAAGKEAAKGAEVQRELEDAMLETRAKIALMSEIGANAFDVEIEAADGVVTFRGELASDELHDTAIATLDGIAGVTDVVDLVEVA